MDKIMVDNRLEILNQHKTLVLDSSYKPIAIVPWQRAMYLIFTEKAQVLESYPDLAVNSPSTQIALPAVLKVKGICRRKPRVHFNRWGVFARDAFLCAYCGEGFNPKELSLDHIIPLSRGGLKSWDNIITSCLPCNRKKGNKTPEEAGFAMHFKPYEPKWNPLLLFKLNRLGLLEIWKPWLKL